MTMHPYELKVRTELAACYRIFYQLGWTELIHNHIIAPLALAYVWPLQRASEIQLAGGALGATGSIGDAVPAQCAKASLQFDPNDDAGHWLGLEDRMSAA